MTFLFGILIGLAAAIVVAVILLILLAIAVPHIGLEKRTKKR